MFYISIAKQVMGSSVRTPNGKAGQKKIKSDFLTTILLLFIYCTKELFKGYCRHSQFNHKSLSQYIAWWTWHSFVRQSFLLIVSWFVTGGCTRSFLLIFCVLQVESVSYIVVWIALCDIIFWIVVETYLTSC